MIVYNSKCKTCKHDMYVFNSKFAVCTKCHRISRESNNKFLSSAATLLYKEFTPLNAKVASMKDGDVAYGDAFLMFNKFVIKAGVEREDENCIWFFFHITEGPLCKKLPQFDKLNLDKFPELDYHLTNNATLSFCPGSTNQNDTEESIVIILDQLLTLCQ